MQLNLGVAVVTGAASGIGAATARVLAAEGAVVHAWDVDGDRLEGVVNDITAKGGYATARVVDVTDEDSVQAAFSSLPHTGETLRSVAHVAGLQRSGFINDQDPREWHAQLTVNLTGTWLINRHAVVALRESGGAIVNMASLAGIKGAGAGMTAYSASKGGVVALTKSLAAEVASSGIRVNCVCPGWIDTPFNDPIISVLGGRTATQELVARSVPLGRQAAPHEVAGTIAFLLSEHAAYITGIAMVIDGGLLVG